MNFKKNDPRSKQQLLDEINELRVRLAESEESLRAIREGEVDAIIVSGSKGEQVFSLSGSESVYRLIVETMHEAAFTVSFDGQILFCNRQFSSFVGTPQEKIIGRRLQEFVLPELGGEVLPLLTRSRLQPITQRMVFQGAGAPEVPAHISATALLQPDGVSICIVATDLTELETSTELLQKLRTQEQSLRESEAKASALIRYAPTAIYEVDFKGRRFISVNDVMCAILGYSRDELMSMDPSEVLDNESQAVFKERIRQQLAGENITELVEYKVRRKDGSLIDAVLNVTVKGEEGGIERALVVAHDITERKKSEKRTLELLEAIHEEKERLSALVNSISDEVWFADTRKRFTLANPSAIREFALDPDESIDIEKFAASLEIYHPDGTLRPVEESPALLALRGEAVRDQEEIIRTPVSGKLRYRQVNSSPVRDSSGTIIGAVSVVRDITERIRAEEALRQSLDRMRLSSEAARIGVWDWDITGGRLDWDDKTRDIFGVSRETPISYETWLKTIHPDDLAAVKEAVSDTIEGHKDYITEFRIMRPDDSIRWIHSRGKTFFDAAKRPVRMSGIAFDITERKQAEEAVRESEEQLQFALETSHIGAWDLDLSDRTAYRSLEHDRIFGYGELLPDWTYEIFLQHVLPEDREAVDEKFRRAMAGQGDWNFECRIRRADGEVRWIWAAGRHRAGRAGTLSRMTGIVQDIHDRKTAEIEIASRAQELEAVLTAQTDIVLEYDSAMNVIRVNPVFSEMYGFNPLGLNVRDVMNGVSCRMPDGSPIVIEEQPTPRALRGEKVSGMYFAITDRAGKDRLVEVSSAPMPLGGHIAGSVTVWHDVTQLKQAEEELRKAKEGLEERVRERTAELRTALLYNRSLIETSLDPLVTIGPDGTITDVNAATESVTGRTRKELIGTDFLDYFTEPYHARAGYQKVFQDGYVRDYPLEIRHRDGHVTPVLFNASVYRDEGGAIVGIFAAARDITERRRAELTINAERQRLYDVMETLPVYVILLSKEYHVPFANRFFRERFGESHGSRCYEYLFNRTEPCETCESYTVMRTNKPHHWEWTGPDRRNYDIYDYPFTDTDGSTMILEMGIDITDVKEAQAALQEANQMLEQRVAERTAELARSNLDLEQFAYVASHDLQEPLRNVGAFVNLLQKRYQDRLDQNANEYIGFALEGVTRMQGLIADLLVYSRVGTRDRELFPIDAVSVLERALANLRSSINESGAKVTFDTLPTVTASPVQLTLLLQNLIGNAIKFRGSHTPRVHIGVTRQQGFWVFSVRDNGIGIEPQYQERIFLIFQRLHTREEYPGTGIGLAICKKIVERHGGRIWFDSQPGLGTIFYFTIPAHEGNAP